MKIKNNIFMKILYKKNLILLIIFINCSIFAQSTGTFNILKVNIEAENTLTECMEGRTVTFTATLSPALTDEATYNFSWIDEDGNLAEKTDTSSTGSMTLDVDMGEVLDGDDDHKLEFAIDVYAEVKGISTLHSSFCRLDVYELWIKHFKDKKTGKDWKVCVGRNIEYEAFASSDCVEWIWDMEDGWGDAWNPTGGNEKTGDTMYIPYSDLDGASNSWFGDTYGNVTVSCDDGDGNEFSFDSTDMDPSTKASVFFDPDKNIKGLTPTQFHKPAWYVFWKEGNVVEGISDFGYLINQEWGYTTSTGFLYFGRKSCNYS